MSTNKQSAKVTLYLAMVEGIQKHFSSMPEILLGGVSYTPAALAKVFQDLADVAGAVLTARSALRDAITAHRNKDKADSFIVRAFKAFVLSAYADAKVLADFGLVPRKPRKAATGPTLVEAAKRRLATRVARHTMGKKQKSKIKGIVPPAVTNGSAGAPEASAPAATAASTPTVVSNRNPPA